MRGALALVLLVTSLAGPAWGMAQPPPPLPQDLVPAEADALEQISRLQGPMRRDVLRVASHPAGLVALEGLARSVTVTDEKLDALVAGYPSESRDAFRAVFSNPELLQYLLENLKLVVALGATWRLDPPRTEAALEQLGRQVEHERTEAAARAEAAAREAERQAAVRAADEQAERAARRWRYDPWWYGPNFAWGYGSGWYGSPWTWGCW